jgi:uncharacterized protein YndB with AHSA1/START domain
MQRNNPDALQKGQMIVEGEHVTITFKRTLHHAPELVWDAITKPHELKEWLMCSSAKIEGRTGGTIEMVSGYAQFHVTGKILTWDPPHVYEHEWKVAPVSEMPRGEDAIFRYELTRQGSSTLLTVTYRRITKQTALGFTPGIHVLLDRLEAQLGGEPLPDWITRFQETRRLYPAWSK